jgi:hypothetical protein
MTYTEEHSFSPETLSRQSGISFLGPYGTEVYCGKYIRAQ